MRQRRNGVRFALEPRPCRSVSGQRFGQNLDGDIARQSRIACAIHFAHATSPERREDFVAAETRAWGDRHGKWRRLYGPRPSMLMSAARWARLTSTDSVRSRSHFTRPPASQMKRPDRGLGDQCPSCPTGVSGRPTSQQSNRCRLRQSTKNAGDGTFPQAVEHRSRENESALRRALDGGSASPFRWWTSV
jgi:hypothetical protein